MSLFGAKPAASGAPGGLSISTTSANSLFGNTAQAQPATGGLFGNKTSTPTTQAQSGGLFGNLGATSQPATTAPASGGLFGNLGGNAAGSTPATTSAPASGGLFGNLGGSTATSTATTTAAPSGGLFGNMGATGTAQPQQQTGSLFGGLGASTAPSKPQTSSLFGGTTTNASQPQQPSLLGGLGQSTAQNQQQAQNTTTVQGVRVDISNLHSTTKFEACEPVLQNQITEIDAMILKQISLCNEVSDLLPAIADQGATIPSDVDFVKQKLETLQHGLETDAIEIDQVRQFIEKDAAEARLAFRAIDALQLPSQWQVTGGYGGSGWWNSSQPAVRGPSRSSAIVAEATADNNGGPANLVEYFSGKADEMSAVLGNFKNNMAEVEDHLGYVERLLMSQINDFMANRNRGSAGAYSADGARQKSLAELTAALGEVENSILAVAGRVGGVREEVQGAILGQSNGL